MGNCERGVPPSGGDSEPPQPPNAGEPPADDESGDESLRGGVKAYQWDVEVEESGRKHLYRLVFDEDDVPIIPSDEAWAWWIEFEHKLTDEQQRQFFQNWRGLLREALQKFYRSDEGDYSGPKERAEE